MTTLSESNERASRLCLTLASALLVLFTVSDLAQARERFCKGYPQDQECCKFYNGTWAVGGSGGFCYLVWEIVHYDVGTSVRVPASGYGGPGHSGGAGDQLIRIVNPSHDSTVQKGTLCAMIYVFDDNEQMQACCGCAVTPDGLRTLSVINDATANFGVRGGNLTAGVIGIIANDPNFENINDLPFGSLANRGINFSGLWGCDPWESHAETMAPAFPSTSFTTSVSTEEFAPSQLDSTELSNLSGTCLLTIQNSSTAGACTCGSGDDVSSR